MDARKEPAAYVIVGPDGDYWSNAVGWTEFAEQATRFTKREIHGMLLPVDTRDVKNLREETMDARREAVRDFRRQWQIMAEIVEEMSLEEFRASINTLSIIEDLKELAIKKMNVRENPINKCFLCDYVEEGGDCTYACLERGCIVEWTTKEDERGGYPCLKGEYGALHNLTEFWAYYEWKTIDIEHKERFIKRVRKISELPDRE